ncbi:hypothetical protein C0J50_14127 [Silurus asotus]|uniref:Reverse transcriptase domain-containing protein n=1 Tax=Silurus asotus TaxID=30991 RepID=A0AAD5B2I7_SILAS|nr:hypothetical protein C0J50_14127 [Silurus asotus]
MRVNMILTFINLEKDTSTVTSYNGKCNDDVTAKVRALLKSRDSAFRAGDKMALKTARAKLSHAIREQSAHTRRESTTTSRTDETPDFSSAFIIYQHLIEKLSLCNWILDFLTGNSISSTTTLSTGAPQGCVFSPSLFSPLTYDCVAMHSSNHIIKLTDDITVMGLISKNDESAYREEVQWLTAWCGANNLSLNIAKTKDMVVDFRKAQSDHSPLIIDRSSMEFLGVHLAENFTWSLNTSSITKKAQQRLYFLRRLRKTYLPPPILTTFYSGTI